MGLASVSIPGVEVLEELGRGAHGAVYRVRRNGRYYAAKVPLHSTTGAESELVARRFFREAVALARVRHRALPRVMEVGRSISAPYIILELAAGETLADRLLDGPLEESQVREIAKELADALVQIHESALSHRDVKPANILFDSATTAVRLVDFGFAAIARPPESEPDDGAISFALGEARADLFALGRVLFECLTGRAPFANGDPAFAFDRRGDDGESSLRVSRALARVVERLLGVGNDAPYTDARELSEDLRQLEVPELEGSARARSLCVKLGRSSRWPLLGRERELERLRAARRASVSGRCQVVLIRGSRGSGKTSLLSGFMEEAARSSAAWFAVGCKSSERAPFGAVRQIVEALLDAHDELVPGKRLAAIANLRAVAGEMAPLLRLLSPRLARVFHDAASLPRNEGAEHIFSEGLTECLGKLFADLGHTVVVVDDVQWLDAGSRRVLGRLTDRGNSSVLYVFSARDEQDSIEDVQRLTRSLEPDRVWDLRLEPFDERGIVELTRAFLGWERPSPDLVRCVEQLSDGTPLCLLEILHSMLDAGVLVPSWGEWKFDARAASSMGLPRGSLELVSRRIADVEPLTARALSVAAVMGVVFEHELLAGVCRTSPERMLAMLTEPHRAALIEPISEKAHRFMHDSVRDALLERLGAAELRSIHEDVAEVLEEQLGSQARDAPASDSWLLGKVALPDATAVPPEASEETETARVELVFALAGHYVDGERTRHPERVAAACKAAGGLAFRSFDNERALRFFDVAIESLRRLDRELEIDLLLVTAEARLRTGALDAGCAELRLAVDRSEDPVIRAYALSRIAWAEMQSDTERAWAALREAFAVLGIRALSGVSGAALAPVQVLFRRPFSQKRAALGLAERRRLTVVSELYYQSARLASDTGKNSLFIEAVLKNLEPAERLGPSAALNKSYLGYALLFTMLGARNRGRRFLAQAYAVASETRSPIVQAFTLQVHAMLAAWSGDFREALEIGARLLADYGHFREIGDYVTSAFIQEQIEGVRGRPSDGWKWLERAIEKLTKHEGATTVLDFIEVSARASLTALGREHEAERLLSRLGHLTRRLPARGNISTMAYGAHVRLFTEKGNLGPEFEEYVAEVRGKNFDPRRVHLVVTEYYVHVAHARVHACLRAEPSSLPARRAELGPALDELRRGARSALFKAHVAAVEGYDAFFRDDLVEAERAFARAEALGREQGAPWVLYSVHRGRAHVLRHSGRMDEARDQARLAEALAREHGAAYRVRWVREEFSLRGQHLLGSGERSSSSPVSPGTPSHASDSERPAARARQRGYLRSLVRIGHSTAKELELGHQIRVALHELIEAVQAERGYLFLTRSRLSEEQDHSGPNSERSTSAELQGGAERLVLACAKSASGEEPPESGFDPKLVEDLWVFGNLELSEDGGLPGVGTITTFGERAVVATSLVVRGGRLGVVYLDRPLRAGGFSDADARLLAALAGQVPLVIELARSLRMRERVEETQRSADKLEAIGRLAGGIAHDFNNMLSVILTASDQILSRREGHSVNHDAETIQSAAERARDLTRQLLAFSRGQYLNPEVLDLNEVIRRLEPIFKRLGSPAVTLRIALDPELCRVKADPAQIDQVLTNLVVNACDAMLAGGELTIETCRVVVPPRRPNDKGVLPPGRYARIVVSDTGKGMDEETRAKAFEPFFTTKSGGNGLGLATAYGIITQSGGHIELESQLGVGTAFRLFLPETVQRPSSMPAPTHSQRLPRGSETILLVDDEPLVRESTRRMLNSLGYKVITAKNSEEALRIASDRLDSIDLVISDVIMPGMNGLELARELAKLRPDIRILFVSGFTAGVLTERGVFRDAVEFLQKPVPLDTLATRIRAMVQPKRADEALLRSKVE